MNINLSYSTLVLVQPNVAMLPVAVRLVSGSLTDWTIGVFSC